MKSIETQERRFKNKFKADLFPFLYPSSYPLKHFLLLYFLGFHKKYLIYFMSVVFFNVLLVCVFYVAFKGHDESKYFM